LLYTLCSEPIFREYELFVGNQLNGASRRGWFIGSLQ
jgi:hypothetical protein